MAISKFGMVRYSAGILNAVSIIRAIYLKYQTFDNCFYLKLLIFNTLF